MNTTRRDFLQKSLVIAAGAAAAPVTKLAAAPKAKAATATGAAAPSVNPQSKPRPRRATLFAPSSPDKLAGFIVSDAHFGWIAPQQPLPDEQRRAMDTIMARFPALDLMLDTGDAHHDYATDRARGDWTDVIQGGCDAKPFHYIAGNHDNNNSLTVDDKFYDYDSEFRTNTFASIECQPYYSFDHKGIHFVSLPELHDQCYITDASLAWLNLDLAVHKDKTTIILSHNAITGTTKGSPGYRQVTNSAALEAIFKQNPQIVAWMHGHNHTYEVVPRGDMLFVSNGRIGGFDPYDKPAGRNGKAKTAAAAATSIGAGSLGGIYFEVTRDAFTVRCFNASQNKFFDELPGYEKLRHTLPIKNSSFDPAAPPAINFGFGGSPHGQRIDAYRHHAGGERTLYLTGAPTPVINENPEFKVYTERDGTWATKHLSGYSFEPNEEDAVKTDHMWEWRAPAADTPAHARILRRADLASTKAIFAPGATLGQRSYFRCAPGQTYKLTATVDAGAAGGQRATPEYRLFDKHFVRMSRDQGPAKTLPAGRSEITWEFTVPPLENIATLYSDPITDNDLMLTTGIVFGNVAADIDILTFRLTHADATGDDNVTIAPVVEIDGISIGGKGPLREGEICSISIAAPATDRTTYAIEAAGNRRLTWLEKQRAPRYQVRNATACYDADGRLVIGPLRNHFSEQQEVIIVPMTSTPPADANPLPYVHRIRHPKFVTIREATPQDRSIEIKVDGLWVHNLGEVDIVCAAPPTSVTGVGKLPGTAKPAGAYNPETATYTLHVERIGTYKLAW